jgi:CheY-like chemotaxis protein
MSDPTPSERPDPSKPYILVAEDNSGDVSLIRLALAERGVALEVVVHTDGEKAMEFLGEVDGGTCGGPALVVLDLNLPRVNGREVLARIRNSPVCGKIPVVVFSSSDSARDRDEAEGLGATLYLKKPSNLEDFLEVGTLLKGLLETPLHADSSR